MRTILYIHGKNGSPDEANHYRSLFPDARVIGVDYTAATPWEAGDEFPRLFDRLTAPSDSVTVIANSIGAYFAMSALPQKRVALAYFISPVTDMESLILSMMNWAGVSEDALRTAGEIPTDFGEVLSWRYLSYVREHPISWNVPTHVVYGTRDALIPRPVIDAFASRGTVTLDVLEDGEHWFHTEDQMSFLDEVIRKYEIPGTSDRFLTPLSP